jgi:hypothetical protein
VLSEESWRSNSRASIVVTPCIMYPENWTGD